MSVVASRVRGVSIGRGALWGAADVAALNALETRLEVQETARSAVHGGQLRTVLELAAFYAGRGSVVATVSHAALVLGCSEHRASGLLDEAQGLAELPGAVEAVECGCCAWSSPLCWCGSWRCCRWTVGWRYGGGCRHG
jgi:hypothetical protein